MPIKLDDVDLEKDIDELITCEWDSYENPFQPFFRLFCPVVGDGPDDHAESIKHGTKRQLE